LGGGQLGQMLMLAGYPLGIQTIAFDPAVDVPASLVGAVVSGDIEDTVKLHHWASGMDVVTYEIETYPVELVASLAEVCPVLPGPIALAAAQDRLHEKRLFDELGIPLSPYRLPTSFDEFEQAVGELQTPLFVKTRTGGYDGRGQVRYSGAPDIDDVRSLMANSAVVVEQGVPFQFEASIIGARSTSGDIVTYPITQNEHRHGILHKSVVPAAVTPEMQADAEKYITALLKHLDYVGVLALEMFVVDGRLLANEIAPRVHNSGHWTIEGAETSQFENHLRAIGGLPLGATGQRGPVAMINIIGRIPNTNELLAVEGTNLHLYGKTARPGRKLGHVTITAGDADELRHRLDRVEAIIDNELF
jgi:5-(carboxyamino)imidazole ribonucleotide synthase